MCDHPNREAAMIVGEGVSTFGKAVVAIAFLKDLFIEAKRGEES